MIPFSDRIQFRLHSDSWCDHRNYALAVELVDDLEDEEPDLLDDTVIQCTGPFNINVVCNKPDAGHVEIYAPDFTVYILTTSEHASVTCVTPNGQSLRTFKNWDYIDIQRYLFKILNKSELPKSLQNKIEPRPVETPKPVKQTKTFTQSVWSFIRGY